MTSREHRLQRLVDLRTQQHQATTAQLRAARALLEEAERTMQQGMQQARDAHGKMARTLSQQDQQGWLLACADAEFSKLAISMGTQKQAKAAELMEAAAAREADARRERKQMEKTLELIAKEEVTLASRAEQQHLDETARLLSGSLSSAALSGRVR